MRVYVYKNPIEFWNKVAPILKKEEAKNCLLLGLSYLFRTDPENCVFQAAVFDDVELLGAVVVSQYRTNNNLLLSQVSNSKVIDLLFKELTANNIKVSGIVGEIETASSYQKLYEISGLNTKVHLKQGVYRCRDVQMPSILPGLNFRLANQTDVNLIGKWSELFRDEVVPHDPPVNGVEFVKPKIKNKMIYILEKENEPVSMAMWSRDINSSCAVSFVYTPRPHRRNGYASIVTAQLTDYLLKSGKNETNLFTDISNPTSNKIYMNIGYEFVCNSIHLGVESENI